MLMLGDDKITLATKSGGAIGISGKDVTVTGDNMIADCSKNFVANAGTVYLAKGASEPAVRGICRQLPGLRDSQQRLAASLPPYKPYATLDADDIADCESDVRQEFAVR